YSVFPSPNPRQGSGNGSARSASRRDVAIEGSICGGQCVNLLHVMAGVEQMKFTPSAEADGSQNGMVGDLHFVPKLPLAFGKGDIHLLQVGEDQVLCFAAADSRGFNSFGRFSA